MEKEEEEDVRRRRRKREGESEEKRRSRTDTDAGALISGSGLGEPGQRRHRYRETCSIIAPAQGLARVHNTSFETGLEKKEKPRRDLYISVGVRTMFAHSRCSLKAIKTAA